MSQTFLLKEDADKLLLEDGFFIVLTSMSAFEATTSIQTRLGRRAATLQRLDESTSIMTTLSRQVSVN